MADQTPLPDDDLVGIKMSAQTCSYCKPDILSLVAEVERLRAENKRLTAMADEPITVPSEIQFDPRGLDKR